jgi:MarR family transcriptional regulator for hemolysin
LLKYDFEESVGCWVVSTAHALHKALNEELSHHGITYRQWQVLAWLALEGELAQAELSERIGIEAPTLAGVLDRMARDGWIERESSPSDRRKKLVRPAPRAEQVWSRMVACARKVRARALAGIDERRIRELRATLGAIRGNLGAVRDRTCRSLPAGAARTAR